LAPRPLYGLERLAARPDSAALVVEGEKAADAAEGLFPDHVAVTSPGGGKAAAKACWSALAERHVVIWPDHDREGAGYADAVQRFARASGAASIRVVQIPADFPPKWDLADSAPEGWTVEGLRDLLESAPLVTEPGDQVNGTSEATGSQENIDNAVAELAKLSPLKYERVREAEAKRLGVRVGTLDSEVTKLKKADAEVAPGQGRPLELASPDPWPEPVDGTALLRELTQELARYLVLPEGAATAIALWILHAHAFDASPVTPRLAITSPERRCGKTTLLRIVGTLVPKPLPASNVTAAALFRTIEMARPTLLIDEADTFLPGSEELRGVLNSGHCRDGNVVRLVGDEHEPRQFSTWAPVAIACIGKLPGTVTDRSIIVRMKRRRRDERLERLRIDRQHAFGELCRRCARWVKDHYTTLADADPAMPEMLNDRAADNWRPLLSIADAAGGEWPEQARRVAMILAGLDNGDDSSVLVMLLTDLRAIFAERQVDRLPSEKMCDALAKLEHRPWPEWKAGKPITQRQLAKLLAPLQIIPGTIRLDSGQTPKGYYLDAFADAFARYLPAADAVDPPHRHNPQESEKNRQSRSATGSSDVADRNLKNPSDSAPCGGSKGGRRGGGSMDGMNLLQKAHAAGLAVAAHGGRLVIRGPRRAGPVARLLIEHKPEIMAVLADADSPPTDHAADWRELYEESAAIRQFEAGYPKPIADRLAYGELTEKWCERHPAQTDPNRCAGCGGMLGIDVLSLADGARVHFEPHREFRCLIDYGLVRKRRAVAALAKLGLAPPWGWQD
jgi:putative DNA primase/helicase